MADSAIFLQVLWPFKIFLSRHKISGVSFRSKEVKSYRRFFVEALVAKIPIGRWRLCRSLKIHEVSLVKFASNNRQRKFWFRTVQQIFPYFWKYVTLQKLYKKINIDDNKIFQNGELKFFNVLYDLLELIFANR